MRNLIHGAAALAVFSLLIAGGQVKAQPGWQNRVQPISDDPAVGDWISRQHNQMGGYCCDGGDAHLYSGAYTVNADGSVTAEADDGSKVTIDALKVLPFNSADPNPTGSAVWWYNAPNGLGTATARGTYCFALGALS